MKLRTYWHLQNSRTQPTAYDYGSNLLLYYPQHGFSVDTSVARWFIEFQAQLNQSIPSGKFSDPRMTTYDSYIELQYQQELHVNQLLESMNDEVYIANFSDDWLHLLDNVLPQLRFPCHALQMQSAYLAHMFHDSKIVNVFLFQAADEMRQVQRFAYRTAQLRHVDSHFGLASKEKWLQDPIWQPLRSMTEALLTTYNPIELFIFLNLCYKPAFEHLFLLEFSQIAQKNGDYLWTEVNKSLFQDCIWHQDIASTLWKILISTGNENKALLDKYQKLVMEFVTITSGLFSEFCAISDILAIKDRTIHCLLSKGADHA